MEANIYQKAIEQLIMEGYTIIQVAVPHTDEFLFFVVYKWQEGYFNTAQSVDFNTIEGVNITDFLNKNASQCSNRSVFLAQFNRVIEEGVLVRCEFNKNATWFKWGVPNGAKKIVI